MGCPIHTNNRTFTPVDRPWRRLLASLQERNTPTLPTTGRFMLDAFLAEPMGHGPYNNIGAVLLGVGRAVNGAARQEVDEAVSVFAAYGGSDTTLGDDMDDTFEDVECPLAHYSGDAEQQGIDLLGVGAGIHPVTVEDVDAFMQDINGVLV